MKEQQSKQKPEDVVSVELEESKENPEACRNELDI